MMLGAQSRREVQPSRFRVLAAMRTQTVEQGRYLGGRPPYGHRLVDASPHPTAAHARWGRRLHRLDPDPATAEHALLERNLADREAFDGPAGRAPAATNARQLPPSPASSALVCYRRIRERRRTLSVAS